METPNTIYDRTLRDPIDRKAAIVTAPCPKHSVPLNHSRSNFKSMAIPNEQQFCRDAVMDNRRAPPQVPSRIGMVMGRMKCIAYSHSRKLSKTQGTRHYWVVRCSCGNLELRRSEALRAGKTMMCAPCEKTVNDSQNHKRQMELMRGATQEVQRQPSA